MNILKTTKGRIINVLHCGIRFAWKVSPRITASVVAFFPSIHPPMWGTNFKKYLIEYLPCYLSNDEIRNKKIVYNIKKDMLMCWHLYGINAQEYLIHSFRNKSISEREKYLSKALKDQSLQKQLGEKSEQACLELKDKYQFYSIAGTYFNRDACCINNEDDFFSFERFVNKHKRFFCKPIKGRYGRGNSIVNIDDLSLSPKELFNNLLNEGTWIIEELIDQDERMGLWNESSVNTIRIPSFRTKEGFKMLCPFIRMGRKGSVVDNAGSGGIMAVVDEKTGKICSIGKDEHGHDYEINPDNGITLVGWQVPEWNKVIEKSKEVHASLPEYHKYVGFDFALTKEHGWVLVEGNWGDFICQQSCLGRGLKNEFLSLLNE